MGWRLDKKQAGIKRDAKGKFYLVDTGMNDLMSQLKVSLKRMLTLERGIKDIPHAALDILTEGFRVSPYHSAHVMAVVLIVHWIVIGVLIAKI